MRLHYLLYLQLERPVRSCFWQMEFLEKQTLGKSLLLNLKRMRVGFFVLLFFIVACEWYETPEGHRQGEEDLGGSVQPHLRVHERVPLEQAHKTCQITAFGVENIESFDDCFWRPSVWVSVGSSDQLGTWLCTRCLQNSEMLLPLGLHPHYSKCSQVKATVSVVS